VAKRKPEHLKLVQGTSRKDRSNPDAPTPPDELPVAPDTLTSNGKAHFVRLVAIIDGMGVASSADVDAVAMAATRLDEIDLAGLEIEHAGMVVTSINARGDKMLRGHPAVRQRSEAMRHLQSLLAEFGLTPAARTKVSAKKPAPKTSAFTQRS
jgi:P27 family predicted phage terminase small subunit